MAIARHLPAFEASPMVLCPHDANEANHTRGYHREPVAPTTFLSPRDS